MRQSGKLALYYQHKVAQQTGQLPDLLARLPVAYICINTTPISLNKKSKPSNIIVVWKRELFGYQLMVSIAPYNLN